MNEIVSEMQKKRDATERLVSHSLAAAAAAAAAAVATPAAAAAVAAAVVAAADNDDVTAAAAAHVLVIQERMKILQLQMKLLRVCLFAALIQKKKY